jgi:hypothetical protein
MVLAVSAALRKYVSSVATPEVGARGFSENLTEKENEQNNA